MTKLKIKENVGSAEAIDESYPFEDIDSGDMFYCYGADTLIIVIDDREGEYHLIDLTNGEIISGDDDKYFEDTFDRLTEEYGEWYPVNKTKITFKVGE